MDRPNHPSDPTQPNRVARPVRPAALDAIEVERPPEPPRTPPARTTAAAEEVFELTAPCQNCGYDLRGLPAGGRCPECGGKIPHRDRKFADRNHQRELRETLSDAWRGFSIAALGPIVLLTPLPFAMPFGVGVAVAVAFAPLFRLQSLKTLRTMPSELRAPVDRSLDALRAWQYAELAPIAVVVAFALGATFAAIPVQYTEIYFATIVLWWLLAIEVVTRVLTTGQALAQTLVDPAAIPPIGRAVLCARIGQITAAAGFAAVLLGRILLAEASPEQTIVVTAGTVLLLPAAVLGGYACVIGYAHAPIVSECIYDAECFRGRNGDRELDAVLPPPAPVDERPPRSDGRPAWEDDERIPLA